MKLKAGLDISTNEWNVQSKYKCWKSFFESFYVEYSTVCMEMNYRQQENTNKNNLKCRAVEEFSSLSEEIRGVIMRYWAQ